MTAMLHAVAEGVESIQFSNGHFTALCHRGVLLPAGVFVANGFDYTTDEGRGRLTDVRVKASEAIAVGMAMRGFANAVRLGDENRREWVTRFDRENTAMADGIIAFCVACGGFTIS